MTLVIHDKTCSYCATGALNQDDNANAATAQKSADNLQGSHTDAQTDATQPGFGDDQLHGVLQSLDKSIGRIIKALPVNDMLIMITCKGDTAEFRRMQVSIHVVRCCNTIFCAVHISVSTSSQDCILSHLRVYI